jgi:hypothetical protein
VEEMVWSNLMMMMDSPHHHPCLLLVVVRRKRRRTSISYFSPIPASSCFLFLSTENKCSSYTTAVVVAISQISEAITIQKPEEAAAAATATSSPLSSILQTTHFAQKSILG